MDKVIDKKEISLIAIEILNYLLLRYYRFLSGEISSEDLIESLGAVLLAYIGKFDIFLSMSPKEELLDIATLFQIEFCEGKYNIPEFLEWLKESSMKDKVHSFYEELTKDI